MTRNLQIDNLQVEKIKANDIELNDISIADVIDEGVTEKFNELVQPIEDEYNEIISMLTDATARLENL